MSKKITKEIFLQRFYQRYSDAKIEILIYEIINNSGRLKNLDILSDLSNSTTISAKESTL